MCTMVTRDLYSSSKNYVDLLCKEFEEEEEKEDKKCGGDGNSVAGEDSSYDSDYEGSEEPKRHDDVSRTVSDTLSAEFSEYVSISSPPLSPSSPGTYASAAASTDSGYISRVEFALKLGYTEKLVQAALQKLGPNPEQNELLAELIKLCAQTGTKLKYDLLDNDEDSSEFTNDNIPTSQGVDVMKLRPIVIDGSNVAMSHGNKEVFSCRGIKICVDWFRSRGHNEITVFVPKWRKETLRPDNFVIDQDILSELEKERLLVFTPSREIRGKRMVCYDDRYILKLAAENDGIVVSNDNYRDLVQECPEFRKVVEERILMYSFVNDRFMPPDDPLGRSGPTLDNFLKGMQKKADNCPYGKKCTYGNKCKYNHPERGLLPQKSVTERLAERAQKQLQARNQEIGLGKQLKGKSLSVPLSSTPEDSSNVKAGSLKKTPLARTKSTSSASRASDLIENKSDNYDSSVRSPQAQHALAQSISTIWSSSQRNPQQWKHTSAPVPTSQPPSIPYVNVSYATESAGLPSASSSVAGKTKHSDWHASLDFPSSSGLTMVHNSPTGGSQRANIHRKLQRELSINPAYDSRLFQMQKYQQSASGPTEVSHQNLTRHYSFQTGDGNGYSLMVPSASHCSVTRIASAPSSNPPLYTIPHPAVISSIGASSSDSRLNVGLPNLQQSYNSTPPNWAAAGIGGPPSIFGSTNVPVNLSTEEIRQKLRYHLASLFPENQVDTVMNMYPNESNPQKLCAAILTMFPARS